MKSVTAVLTLADECHPISPVLAEETGLTERTTRQLNILDDGTMNLLGDVRCDLDCTRQLLDDHPDVLSYSVFREQDREGLIYIHTRPSESIREIIQIPREHEVVFEFPIEGINNDTIRVTLIGETNGSLQQALTTLPDGVDVTLERIGAYPPEMRDMSSMLTERQQEILDIAADLGYYEVPRQATHADIAERAGLNPGTVSEHMQRIEARVFATLTD